MTEEELSNLKYLLKKYRRMYASDMQEVDDIQQISNNVEKILQEKAFITE